MPRLGEDDPGFERLRAEANAVMAAAAGHPENLVREHGWQLGWLAVDPATGTAPALELVTAEGTARLELTPAVCADYAVVEKRWAAGHPEQFAGRQDDDTAEGDWCLLQLCWPPVRRPRYLGTLLTSLPVSRPGKVTPAGAMALGSAGESLAIETEWGLDRWLLMPAYGYQLNYRSDLKRWSVRETAEETEDEAEDWATQPPTS